MITVRVLLLLLLALPPWWGDRQETGRIARLERIALATNGAVDRATCTNEPEECRPLWSVSERDDLTLLLVALAWHETRLARHIHENRCGRYECGPYFRDGKLYHASRGPWQLERSAFIAEQWDAVQGSDQTSTNAAAWGAVKVLAHGRRRCGTLRGAVSLYATGKRCSWSGADERMRTFRRLQRKAEEVRDAD
jgi:hypothetical protein